jgi:4-alpha-glucanotransferase
MKKRGSGILLHITSLPSEYGIGDFGPDAYTFADFLKKTEQCYWQILPITATDQGTGSSPYCCVSAYAGNTYLISPALLYRDGLLNKSDTASVPAFPQKRVHFSQVVRYKEKLFHKAFVRFQKKRKYQRGYKNFCGAHKNWLDDYCLFTALKNHCEHNVWSSWHRDLRDRKPGALRTVKKQFRETIEFEKFLQYIFFRQWALLKKYCNKRGIQIIGDIPIYVDYNSVDVWKRPEIFKLNRAKKPISVSGVPPDYFSRTGQLWGNPVYSWRVLKKERYQWWMARIAHNLTLFDFVRIDHFRGFVAHWEVKAGRKTARRGKWVRNPARDFLTTLVTRVSSERIIAEDLGTITPDVRKLIRDFGFPGMKVLLFAFNQGPDTSLYLPHNHIQNCLVYTGTHDNNTIRGWFENEATKRAKKRLFRYLGREVSKHNLPWEMIRLCMASVADTVIIPMQDILGLGKSARMNRPASGRGNWQWRLTPQQVSSAFIKKLRMMTETYARD